MKPIKRLFYLCIVLSFVSFYSKGQETKKLYERLEIGTDISSIFEENLSGFPGSLIFRIYHKSNPIAYRFSIYNNYFGNSKDVTRDITTSKFNRYKLGLGAGIDWFFIKKDFYQMYFGNEIGGGMDYYKTPYLDDDGNSVRDEYTHSKNYAFSDYFNLGVKIKVLKSLYLGVESKLSFTYQKYRLYDENNQGTTTNKIENTDFFVDFDSFHSLTLLYHF